MHIIGTDYYFDVEFHSWTSNNSGGGFSYTRTPVDGPDLPEGYFRKPDFADASLPENQDRISDEIWITRGNSQALYNAAYEGSYNWNGGHSHTGGPSPSGTEWASGPTENHSSIESYNTFLGAVGGEWGTENLAGQTYSMHIIGTDQYYDIQFHSYTMDQQNGGGFAYIRTPAVGPEIPEGYFRKLNYGDPNLSFYQDRITDDVWLTRSNERGLYNKYSESGYNENNSPSGTVWSMGLTGHQRNSDSYSSFHMATGESDHGDNLQALVGQIMSLHITGTDIFYDVEFHQWTSNYDGGGFAYTRSLAELDTVNHSLDAVYFIKNDFSDPNSDNNQDWITDNVRITRGDSEPLYNAAIESEYIGGISPANTLWASGSTSSQNSSDSYSDFMSSLDTELRFLPGKIMSMRVDGTDDFYDVLFHSWTNDSEYDWDGQNGGGFSYTRTPANISTGCTNYYADNYDENASIDDGSCIYYDETVVFTKEDFGDQSLVENQDRISEDVWLTRSDNGGLFNFISESNYEQDSSPQGTKWVRGKTSNQTVYNYTHFYSAAGGSFNSIIGDTFSLHLENLDIYFDVVFTSWTEGNNGGGFSYFRIPSEKPPISGCMDIYADNYDETVEFDDGSCIYFQEAVTFTKEDYADPNSEEAQDRILGNIWITRGNNKPLYNAALEGSYDDSHHDKSISPANTEWADGPTANHSSILSYKSLKSVVGSNFRDLPGRTLSMHIIGTDYYFDVEFHSWTSNNSGGGFSYTRTPVDGPDLPEGYFRKPDFADASLPENQDRISDEIWITRGNSQALYNAAYEGSYNWNGGHSHTGGPSPSGTEWASGPTENHSSIESYNTFLGAVGGEWGTENLAGQTYSMHIIGTDQYYDIQFHSYTMDQQNGGGFAYIRTPAVGPEIPEGYFRKLNYGDPNLSFYQDRITDDVWLTRSNERGLYNKYSESGYNENNSPSGTKWYSGVTNSDTDLSNYTNLKDAAGGQLQNLPGQTMSLYIESNETFYDVTFHSWQCCGQGGGYSYTRVEAYGCTDPYAQIMTQRQTLMMVVVQDIMKTVNTRLVLMVLMDQ